MNKLISDLPSRTRTSIRAIGAVLPRRRAWLSGIGLTALAVATFHLLTPIGNAQQRPAKAERNAAGHAVPVMAVPAKADDMEVYLDGLGSVAPFNTVVVKSRIDGQLMRLLFKEGQMVEAGDLLAKIDARPYEVQLAQAEAQKERDEALLKNARVDLERYRVLDQQSSISAQQLDTQAALVHQHEATVKIDQTAIDNAKMLLGYCNITAPVAGRVGLRQIDAGNLVRANDTNGIVVITQLQPIGVVFSIPEDSLPAVMKKLQAGEQLPVEAFDRSGKTSLAAGTLLTADNQIDPSTGTVKLKAQFANADFSLFPNQFVNVHMRLDVARGATVIPSAAVQRGTQGPFVYAVTADNTVAMHAVTLGPSRNGSVAVTAGVIPEEMVVVDGADKLSEGAKVELASADAGAAQKRPHHEGKKKKHKNDIAAASEG